MHHPGKVDNTQRMQQRSCLISSTSLPLKRDTKLSKAQEKSLYISPSVSNFYGKEIEIWAGFEPVGNTEIKIWGHPSPSAKKGGMAVPC